MTVKSTSELIQYLAYRQPDFGDRESGRLIRQALSPKNSLGIYISPEEAADLVKFTDKLARSRGASQLQRAFGNLPLTQNERRSLVSLVTEKGNLFFSDKDRSEIARRAIVVQKAFLAGPVFQAIGAVATYGASLFIGARVAGSAALLSGDWENPDFEQTVFGDYVEKEPAAPFLPGDPLTEEEMEEWLGTKPGQDFLEWWSDTEDAERFFELRRDPEIWVGDFETSDNPPEESEEEESQYIVTPAVSEYETRMGAPEDGDDKVEGSSDAEPAEEEPPTEPSLNSESAVVRDVPSPLLERRGKWILPSNELLDAQEGEITIEDPMIDEPAEPDARPAVEREDMRLRFEPRTWFRGMSGKMMTPREVSLEYSGRWIAVEDPQAEIIDIVGRGESAEEALNDAKAHDVEEPYLYGVHASPEEGFFVPPVEEYPEHPISIDLDGKPITEREALKKYRDKFLVVSGRDGRILAVRDDFSLALSLTDRPHKYALDPKDRLEIKTTPGSGYAREKLSLKGWVRSLSQYVASWFKK